MSPSTVQIESSEICTSVSVYYPIYIDHRIDAKLEVIKQPSYLIVSSLC